MIIIHKYGNSMRIPANQLTNRILPSRMKHISVFRYMVISVKELNNYLRYLRKSHL